MTNTTHKKARKEDWNPDYYKEYNRRLELVYTLEEEPERCDDVRAYYKLNPIAFIEDWCITYDPRNKDPKPKMMPFILFKKQKDFILYLKELVNIGESGLVEKSRDMGATWLCCAFSVWLWLYMPGSSVGWGSRKEDLVDTLGDPDSIFEKMRMIIDNLPDFIRPEGFNRRRHFAYMKIVNPETKATITGESGDNIGRGGRKTIYFKDESAHYERPEKIEAALGDNTDVQIDISSVNGTGNVFYRRRMAGELWEKGKKLGKGIVRVFIMDWRDNPLKDQAWYDFRRAKYEREGMLHIFAQEVDRDYSGAIKGVIIPGAWVKAAIDAHKIERLGIKITGMKVGAQDVADGGIDKNAFAWRHGIVAKFGDHWGGDAGDAARISIPIGNEAGLQELYYDAIGVGAGYKTEANTMIKQNLVRDGMKILPWFGSAAVLNPTDNIIPGDDKSPTNEDFFENLKAQSWWSVRTRFYKTYQAVRNKAEFPPDELISIDSNMEKLHILVSELSQATQQSSKSGKVVINKTPEGTSSPNLADAFVMMYNPTREISILDVL